MIARRSARHLALALAVLVLLCGCAAGAGSKETAPTGTHEVVHVPGEAPTISDALVRVRPGGLILVAPGTYPEQVTIDKADVTLRGTDRNEVVIDAEGRRSAGVMVIADGVRVENLTVTRALLYGLLFSGIHQDGQVVARGAGGYEAFDPTEFPPLQRFSVDHVTATNNGLYGIYAFNAQHGIITDSWASGSADSGFYVGQCEECDIVVTGNVATRNAVGFENANASDSLSIVSNRFTGNRVGLTLTSDYQEAFVPQRGNLVAGNVISDNNSADSPSQAEGGFGTGIGISGGRDNHVMRNLVVGNQRAGLLWSSSEDLPSTGNRMIDNSLADNGVDVANISGDLAPASDNCVEPAGSVSALPAGLLDGCVGGQPAAAVGALPAVSVPAGMSFLEVPLPGLLPSMAASEQVPDPLPAVVVHPVADDVPVPSADLLADLLASTPRAD